MRSRTTIRWGAFVLAELAGPSRPCVRFFDRLLALCAMAILASGCTGSAGCSGAHEGPLSDLSAGQLLPNRNWITRWPVSKDDRLHVYRFTPDMKHGVYQDRTLFLGFFELFELVQRSGGAERSGGQAGRPTGHPIELDQGTIHFHLPDMDERVTSRYLIERVDGPEPFDLRLTIEPSPRGPNVYYGRHDETATTWHELDALLPAIE